MPSDVQRDLAVTLALSKPTNGTHFVAGQAPVVTVTLKDKFGRKFSKDDFSILNLYMYGPQETTKAKTALKMLNATGDRSKTPHHYVDLLKNTDVKVDSNVLAYNLKPVSDEEAGTYTVSVWAVSKVSGLLQTMELADIQIGTATVEKQIVAKANCAQCHQGADSGKLYLHHIDPGFMPTGLWSLDMEPVRSCKSCHNNDGYAAYSGDIMNPTGDRSVRTPDNIVLRVHGVHFGEELQNTFNTDHTTGNFRHYTGVVFPADALNCTTCHTDDRWKTQPSRQACASCHDKSWFGDVAMMPTTFTAHAGGPQADDKSCALCHSSGATGLAAIPVVHDPSVNVEHDELVVTMSPPANGKYYVAGEKPVATIVIKDSKGVPVDHTKVNTTNYSAANFYVYGPRAESKPVLTTAAAIGNSQSSAAVTNSTPASGSPIKGWALTASDTFKIAVNGGEPQVLTASDGTFTPDQIAAWLNGKLTGVTVTANNTAGTVTITSTVKGNGSRIEIYNSAVTTKMGWKRPGLDIVEHGKIVGKTSGVTMEPLVAMAVLSTVANNLRSTTDTAITRSVANIKYQLADVAGLKPGTYVAYAYVNLANVTTKNGWPRDAFGMVTFQVGTETPEKKVAAGCTQCHGDTVMHLNERNVHPGFFDTDYCKACHDYQRFGTGEGYARTGGTSTSGWAGYGAKPIVARVHGVHKGAYLAHPEEVYEGNPNMASEIIFPQDLRNCTVCHTSETSGTWKTEPSRLACLSCHDSDEAKAHGKAMTIFPSAGYDPYGPLAVETCKVCHGAGKEFAPDKVHNVANPYKPPYPREPE